MYWPPTRAWPWDSGAREGRRDGGHASLLPPFSLNFPVAFSSAIGSLPGSAGCDAGGLKMCSGSELCSPLSTASAWSVKGWWPCSPD